MEKSEVLRKFSSEIEAAMVERYRVVLESGGQVQYKIFVWDDGEIECMQGPVGDNSYLVAKPAETRDLYYVLTVKEPHFDPWDFSDHSAPDDETEQDAERTGIIDWMVSEYETNVSDILEVLIDEAEEGEWL